MPAGLLQGQTVIPKRRDPAVGQKDVTQTFLVSPVMSPNSQKQETSPLCLYNKSHQNNNTFRLQKISSHLDIALHGKMLGPPPLPRNLEPATLKEKPHHVSFPMHQSLNQKRNAKTNRPSIHQLRNVTLKTKEEDVEPELDLHPKL